MTKTSSVKTGTRSRRSWRTTIFSQEILKYASNRLRKDKEIVLAAITQDKRAKEYISSEDLIKDEDIQAILNPPQN